MTLQLTEKMAPSQLPKRLLADGSFEELPQRTPNDFMENGLGWPDHNPEGDAPAVRARARYKLWSETPEKKIMLIDVAEGRASLDEFMAQLTDLELAELSGRPAEHRRGKHLRLRKSAGVRRAELHDSRRPLPAFVSLLSAASARPHGPAPRCWPAPGTAALWKRWERQQPKRSRRTTFPSG
ncbi:MAG: hypothetical protein ACLR2E_09405 [Lachnospiraceae bacterium]